MEWTPLLSGAVRDRALLSAAALMRLMTSAVVVGPRGAALASGSAGLAVCHAVAARAGQDGGRASWPRPAWTALSRCWPASR